MNNKQIILRNASTDLSTTQLMWTLAWSSRRAGRPLSRAVFIGLFALLHAVLFVVGGTFSNRLASAGSAVLSRSPHCGIWNETYWNLAIANGPFPSDKKAMTLSWQAATKNKSEVELSLEYAQQCYSNQSIAVEAFVSKPHTDVQSPTCNTLQRPKLDWTVTEGECPFAAPLCVSPTIVLDTGHIDSHKDLGINAKPQDRVTYRRLTTCTVLNDTGRVTGWEGYIESASDHPIHRVAYANYGPNTWRQTNETYAYSSYASFYTNFSALTTTPYRLHTTLAVVPDSPYNLSGEFVPILGLQQKSADLILSFLSFSGNYLEPIDDPWFSAHLQHQINNTKYPYIDTQYARDSPISTMGCTEQFQWCNPSKDMCTPWLGGDLSQMVESFNSSLTPNQNATFNRMAWATTSASFYSIIGGLGQTTGRSLLAFDKTAGGRTTLSLKLPNNQWQLEVNYWHSIAMAQLQRGIAQWGTGQVAADTRYLLPPQLDQDIWFCQNLMIPSTTFQSFSVITIILILCTGILVITTSPHN